VRLVSWGSALCRGGVHILPTQKDAASNLGRFTSQARPRPQPRRHVNGAGQVPPKPTAHESARPQANQPVGGQHGRPPARCPKLTQKLMTHGGRRNRGAHHRRGVMAARPARGRTGRVRAGATGGCPARSSWARTWRGLPFYSSSGTGGPGHRRQNPPEARPPANQRTADAMTSNDSESVRQPRA
jgi:hypothetical protein